MGTDSVIYIRTDGNTELATGHIMRCLTIAGALTRKGAKVIFLVADSDSEKMIQGRMGDTEYQIVNLRTDYHDTDEELPVLCQFLMSYPGSLLLIDSYFVTPGYLETLSQIIKVAYIDDLYAFPYPVDTVINYDTAPDPEAPCYSLAKNKLLGLAYTPLRDMFSQVQYTLRQNIHNILLTGGGMNDGKFLVEPVRKILDFYRESSSVDTLPKLHLLLGGDLAPCEEMKELIHSNPEQIVLHGFVADMATFLCGFDLVLTAAGTTLYELCALGIPSISYVIADNQVPSAVAFAEAGLVPCLGSFAATDSTDSPVPGADTSPSFTAEQKDFLFDLLTVLLPYEARLMCSENMASAIDKRGADRIAEALLLRMS